jgi:hypothetical protein
MNEKALELFLSNYENKGICEGLKSKVKTIEKEFKKQGVTVYIDYLPWAIVERLFRMQGGKIEVVDWKYSIPFDSKEYDVETGTIETATRDAHFIHLKGYWQGEELDEYYPIFDSQTSRVIKTPDANQLNASRQRGSVRLIARLSGIGLWIFEQQDEDNEPGEIVPKSKQEVEKPKATHKIDEPKTTKWTKGGKTKAEILQEEKDNAMMEALGGFVEEEVVDDDTISSMLFGNVVEPEENANEDNETEDHADLLLKLKGFVAQHKDRILEFKNEKGRALLKDLTIAEMKEIIKELEQA